MGSTGSTGSGEALVSIPNDDTDEDPYEVDMTGIGFDYPRGVSIDFAGPVAHTRWDGAVSSLVYLLEYTDSLLT